MKKIMSLMLVLVLVASCFAGCTKNTRARQFGGKETIDLPAGRKFVNITWKENDLWIVTRQANANDKPTSYEFNEKSSFGVWEGSIFIVEH